MPSANDPRIIPISREDPAVAIWESTLNRSIPKAITAAGVVWKSCGLYRYGKDESTLDNSPPTVVILASDPKDARWTAVTTQIKALMSAAKMAATLVVLEGTIEDTSGGWQNPDPYNDPRQLGESCSIHIGQLKARENGTMGGAVRIRKGAEDRIAGLTNNHVVNKQPAGTSYEVFTDNPVVIPSEGDHITSRPLLNWSAKAGEMLKYADIDPYANGPNFAFSSICDRLQATTGSNTWPVDIQAEWAKFNAAYVPPNNVNIAGVDTAVKNILKLTFPPGFPATVKDDLQLLNKLLNNWGPFMTAYQAYSAVDAIAERGVGRVLAASGLRPSNPPANTNPLIMDWALVNVNPRNRQFSNQSPHLTNFAQRMWQQDQATNRVLASCALAQNPPMRITQTAQLQPNTYVFKIGRTTGATVGEVNGTKSVINGQTTDKIGRNYPNVNNITADQWEVVTTSKLNEETRPGEFLKSFNDHGDSGSWIIDCDGHLVALMWGRSPHTTNSYVIPIDEVFRNINEVSGYTVTLPP